MTVQNTAERKSGPHRGRYRADFPAGTVVFLIGMRINSFRSVRTWFPVFMAMPRMLRELFQQPELGLLGARTWTGWRVVMVQQYWESMDALMAYAASRDAEHLPAWRAFNRRARSNGATGIWHEAYTVDPATSHIIYSNMPLFGMGEATRLVPASEMPPQAIRSKGGPDANSYGTRLRTVTLHRAGRVSRLPMHGP
jgi:hypothetical protein